MKPSVIIDQQPACASRGLFLTSGQNCNRPVDQHTGFCGCCSAQIGRCSCADCNPVPNSSDEDNQDKYEGTGRAHTSAWGQSATGEGNSGEGETRGDNTPVYSSAFKATPVCQPERSQCICDHGHPTDLPSCVCHSLINPLYCGDCHPTVCGCTCAHRDPDGLRNVDDYDDDGDYSERLSMLEVQVKEEEHTFGPRDGTNPTSHPLRKATPATQTYTTMK